MEVIRLQTKEDVQASYPIMSEFSKHLTVSEYCDRMEEMFKEGYELFALKVREEWVCAGGIAIRTDLSNGRHLWVNELATAPDRRCSGYGKNLMSYLEGYAREKGCKKMVLYSGLSRVRAHHFWENGLGYERRGIVFKKEL